jgi:hypothetical protein
MNEMENTNKSRINNTNNIPTMITKETKEKYKNTKKINK